MTPTTLIIGITCIIIAVSKMYFVHIDEQKRPLSGWRLIRWRKKLKAGDHVMIYAAFYEIEEINTERQYAKVKSLFHPHRTTSYPINVIYPESE